MARVPNMKLSTARAELADQGMPGGRYAARLASHRLVRVGWLGAIGKREDRVAESFGGQRVSDDGNPAREHRFGTGHFAHADCGRVASRVDDDQVRLAA